MHMRWRLWLAMGGAFVFCSLVNPAYLSGCGSSEPEENFASEDDMHLLLDAVNATAAFDFTVEGQGYRLELQLEPSPEPAQRTAAPSAFAATAHACGTRTFYQSASACDTTTELRVNGRFDLLAVDDGVSRNLLTEVAVKGAFTVWGPSVSTADLGLTAGDRHHFSLHRMAGGAFELTQLDVAADAELEHDLAYSAR